MKSYSKWLIAAFILCSLAVGCKNNSEPQQTSPTNPGERNSTCQAKNDCDKGLSCVNQRCTTTDFKLDTTVKECHRVQCEDTDDCCGDRPTEAPDGCAGREVICSQPSVPGCSPTACSGNTDCNGGGTCGNGYCSEDLTACDSPADCAEDTCDTASGFCTVSGVACAGDDACTLANTCVSTYCDCSNPDYDPTDPICSDPDCDVSVCNLTCQDQLCLPDPSCETDEDCLGQLGNLCVDDVCVECESDDECDEDGGESCEDGFCEKPCEYDVECGHFEACQDGDCVYVGCESDRQCIFDTVLNEAVGDDARLAQCVPGEGDIGECKLPCEHDGQCSQVESCEDGFCTYIGCDSDHDCTTILNLSNQETSELMPYVTQGICKASADDDDDDDEDDEE